MKTPARVKTVRVLEKRKVLLEFTDGVRRELDLEPYLRGPIFDQLLKDEKAFQSVRVDSQLGTIVWDNGADMDPDVLYGTYQPVWMVDQKIQSATANEQSDEYKKKKD